MAISDYARTAELDGALTDSSHNYDGLVIFSHVPTEEIAVPVGHTDADNIEPSRHRFRNANILGHSVLLRHTALGKTLLDPYYPGYNQSLINDDMPQFMYTNRLHHEGRQVGALQYSFTPVDEKNGLDALPTEQQLQDIWRHAQPEVRAIAAEVAKLQAFSKKLGSLGTALEYADPIAPNSFIIRWDIAASKFLIRSLRSQVLKAYLNQAHLRIRELMAAYQERYGVDQFDVPVVYDDQGDGANIVIPIPKAFNTYDRYTLKEYGRRTGNPLMEQVTATLDALGNHYRHDLNPEVLVSGGFGYAEPNSIGRFVAKEMFIFGLQKPKD